MTTIAIHQPQYLPWVPYLDKIDACDVFVYLDNVQFQRRGVQNRNEIRGQHGPLRLTVPVKADRETHIVDVAIVKDGWQQKHLTSIAHAYSRAPFFDLYFGELRELLMRDFDRLVDLNVAVTDWLCDKLGITTRRLRASELGASGEKEGMILSVCEAVGAATYLSGTGARTYQRQAHFAARGLGLVYQQYKNVPYSQGAPFMADLSSIDLLFHTGPDARSILLAGRREPVSEDQIPLPSAPAPEA